MGIDANPIRAIATDSRQYPGCAMAAFAVLAPAVSAGEFAACPDSRIAIAEPVPAYPSHNEAAVCFGRSTADRPVFVERSVTVGFAVSARVYVESIRVIDPTYTLIGRNRDDYENAHFDAFQPKNVVRTVKRRKFPRADTARQMVPSFSWEVDEQ